MSTVTYQVGAVPESSFVVPFEFWIREDLSVEIDTVETNAFSATGMGNPSGGVLTLNTPVTNCTVYIYRDIGCSRLSSFPVYGEFRIEALNDEIDRITAKVCDSFVYIDNRLPITGGTITGSLVVDQNLNVDGQTNLKDTNVDGDLTVSGAVSLSNVAITGGTIDGSVIGGTNPVAGSFTDISALSLSMTSGIDISSGGVKWLTGSGDPEGAVTAGVGSLFTRIDATSADAVLYVKETGSGNTGWGEAGSGTKVNTGALPPSDTESLWYKTEGDGAGSTYYYFVDVDGGQWVPLSPSGGGGGGSVSSGGGMFKGDNGTVGTGSGDIFRINEQQLDTDVTIDATENASCTGPLTVATGITLTVATGGSLVIV